MTRLPQLCLWNKLHPHATLGPHWNPSPVQRYRRIITRMAVAADVFVNLPDRGYHIEINPGLLATLGRRLKSLQPARTVTIISDETVAPLYAERLGRSLLEAGIEYTLLTLPPGDPSKSLAIAAELYDELAIARHGREQPIIALGGGVVGDLAGFVAATWHRGVPFVQCPTTLEAMIDAGIGGKTAVNHPAGKNLVGAFHQPILVCIDIDCLATLSERDYRAGLAESVKHALIDSVEFFEWHQANSRAIRDRSADILPDLVRRNCEIKVGVVVADEREQSTTGVGRAALNFGHTIGHAIEAASNYALRHGEAVALGMIAELDLAVRLCAFPDADRMAVERLLGELGFECGARNLDGAEIRDRLFSDKKAQGANIRFVAPSAIGQMRWLESPSEADIRSALERIHIS